MHFFPSLPYLWKESLNSEGQQFHIYQQKNSNLSPKTIEHKKKTKTEVWYKKKYWYQFILIQKQYTIITFIWGKHGKMSNSRGLTTWCSPHMKALTVLLYRNYPKMLICWMFCFAEELISGIENTIMEPDRKKTWIFNTLPVVRGCRLGYCFPLHCICWGLFVGLSPKSTNFSKYNWIVQSLLYT